MQGFDVEIRYIRRSRRATIRVLPGKRIRVSVPWGFSQKAVNEVLASKSDWILKTHEIIEVQCKNEPLEWGPGMTLPFLGQPVHVPYSTKPRIIKWYKEIVLTHLQERCAFFAAALGVSFKNVKIRSYKARWGACSSRGELVFNWQIATFPADLVDYVVAHEICHLKEMNHSPRFYAHLQSLGFERKKFHPRLKIMKNIF
jgi:predicted metal-dependent hydrolase